MSNPEAGRSLNVLTQPFGAEGQTPNIPEHAAQNPKEQLPPTETSNKAGIKLRTWGLAPSKIEALQKFTSSFRYDLVLEKVESLEKKSIKIYKIGEREHVGLPAPLDTDDDRLGGQCLDIASQWVAKIHESKLIEELNQNLEEGNRVVPMLHSGSSATHFNKHSDNHCWNGLALVDVDGKFIEGEEIYIDAAFQTIHTVEESKYREEEARLDPESIKTEKEYTAQIGSVDYNLISLSSTLETVTLGASPDHKYVYGLGFARDHETKAIGPVVERIYPNGSHDDYIIYNDQMLTACRTEDSTQDTKEVEEILRIAAGLNLVETENPPIKEYTVWKRPK